MRTDSIEFNTDSYEYYITVTDEFEGIENIKIYTYKSDGTFNSRQFYTSTSLTPGVPGKIVFPITAGAFRVKTDFGTTNTLSNIKNRLVITRVAKETKPETPPESSSEVITPTWMNGGIASSSGADITDPEGMRSSYMEFDINAYTYYITVTNEFEGIDKLRVAIYNPDGSFVVRQSYTSTSLTPGVPGAIKFPITSGKFRLKVDFKLTNTLENINSRLVITKVPKEPSESIPGQIIFNWETGSIDGSTGLDESMSSAMRTNYVEFDTNSYNYYITVTDEYDVNCSTKIYFYNPDGSFKSRKSYSPTSLVVGETESIPFPITTGTFRVRTNYGETNTAENINSRIIITRVPVASAII